MWVQGIFHWWPKAQRTRLRKLPSPRKQLFCGAKRHVDTPRNSRAGITWKTRGSGLEKRAAVWVQCPSSLSSSLSLGLPWPSCAPAVVSLCADEFFGGYVLQPPESKPNFTPLAILAHVLGAIQPYAHFIHVQRLIPHQVCCRVCLLFCCCRSASSSTLFPAIQTCTCFLTGQKKQFVKTPGKITDDDHSVPAYPKLVRDSSLRDQSWEGPFAWTSMAFFMPFWTLPPVPEFICGA